MNTIVSGAPTNAIERFTITITMDGADGDALMRLISVFHRRQIEILQTTYQSVASTRWMVAIVETTTARLRTTVQTLRNTIGVTGYEVFPDPDDPHAVPAEHVRTSVLQERA